MQSDHAASNKYVVGVFSDDQETLEAVRTVRTAGVKIHEVYSPFPIHGIDPALGYQRSRLDIAAFMFGVTGLTFGLTMMTMMMNVDWPMNIGGKPHYGPQFITIAFELTVLFTALGMVGTFMLASGLGPGAQKVIFDPRATDDKFIMAVSIDKNAKLNEQYITEVLKGAGAGEVYTKEVVK